jgi:small conductance mechanosensitive channel
MLNKAKMASIRSEFLADTLIWSLKIILFVIVIYRLGEEDLSFLAIIGAAILAISFH